VAQADEERALRRLQKVEADMVDAEGDGGADQVKVDELKLDLRLLEATKEEAATRRRHLLEQHQSPNGHTAKLLKDDWQAALGALTKARLAAAPPPPVRAAASFELVARARKSSDQTAENFGKEGPTCLPVAYYDPTPDGRLHRALVPSPTAYDEHGDKLPEMASWIVLNLNMRAAAEEAVGKKRSRDDDTLGGRINKHYSHPDEEMWLQPTVESMNLPVALITVRSKPDCVGVVRVASTPEGGGDGPSDKFVPVRVREYKRSSMTCSDALPQAFALGTSVALGLLQGGVPPAQVIVSVEVTNGRSMQFGVVYIACDGLPLCWTLTEELDLSVPRDVIKAHLHLCKVRQHVGTMAKMLHEIGYQQEAAEPERAITHIPNSIWGKVNCLTHRVYPTMSMESSLHHVLSVLTTLYKRGVRDCICFPMGFGLATKSSKADESWYAFFPNLTITSHDNPVAFTENVPDGPTGARFAEAFEMAVREVHDAGVVHGDLYSSNLLSSCMPEDGHLQVKIIDWDTCFHIKDGIPSAWQAVWRDKCKMKGRYSRTKDPRELDLFMVRVVAWATSCDEGTPARQLWTRLAAARTVASSNSCFHDMQELYLDMCLDDELGAEV